ncbi:siderophore ABC transporter substrate-binding protein [Paracoccus aerodenitrificans]|uniref:siderophore ABC transporter substrate-binding protein n=1 Tax=Paracoccus aerodenitrificans TaxID=3017781 RepID=UPI0022F026F2|nr:siderophore ABC transporter substrate-binding protein [Paracoccus aerodenitrificans]WBU64256.1 siderophore ABC transporter substrate-binding protein [Paracoccus aerodenitrificans]
MCRFSTVLFALAALGGTAAAAQDVTIETARGEVVVPAAPETVVAYDLAAIDTLTALGVDLAGVPDRLYLSAFDSLDVTPVGTLFEPDLEALAGIGPDLIIVGGRSAAQLDSVAQVGAAIDMTIGVDLIADGKARIDAYGTVFEKQDEAAKLQSDLDERLAALKTAAEGKGTALIVLTNGTKMAAYGPGSRFGWLHESTGMAPAIPDLSTQENHGNVLTHEAIAEANPDWLFVLDRGAAVGEDGQSAEQTLNSPLIEQTEAWKNDQIVYLPAAELYIGGGGYQSLMTVIDAMTEALGA